MTPPKNNKKQCSNYHQLCLLVLQSDEWTERQLFHTPPPKTNPTKNRPNYSQHTNDTTHHHHHHQPPTTITAYIHQTRHSATYESQSHLELLHLHLLLLQRVLQLVALDPVLHVLQPLGALLKLALEAAPLHHGLVQGVLRRDHLAAVVVPPPLQVVHLPAKDVLTLGRGVLGRLSRKVHDGLQFALAFG